jgi:F-type H+-transporting ATPase subunit epsilon
MKVVIAKVDENLYDGDAVSVTLPGAEGEMTVLGEHEPLITTLKEGVIIVHMGDENREFPIQGGVLEVRHEGVTVIL